ncbi:MAG: SAVED domain-containing protein [Oscillatoriaceae cyanobacterium Prado104]|nr:SAVED domain-containing protein [Oscillatoriaceae cyanobacterium Prado104]
MSKLVRSSLQYPVAIVRNIKGIAAIALSNPRETAIETPWTALAGFVAGIAPLLFSSYNAIIFGAVIAIFLIGIAIEAKKYQIYTENALPIPVVINIANSANSADALNSLFNLIQSRPQYRNYRENINKYLSITESDLVYKYEGDIFDRDRLEDFLKITKHDLERVKRKTPQNSIFYLVYIGPISVAFLIGSMLAREGMLLFQRTQNNNSYQCVMEVKDRSLKEDTPHFEKFDVTYQCSEPPQKNVTIAIDAAAHRIRLNDPSIASYGDIIILQHKTDRAIGYEEDWTQYCREIFKVLNQAQQEYAEIKLVYSMPVSLAIAVGMTAQHFWNILLTNYDGKTGSYQDLIKMNEIIYRD